MDVSLAVKLVSIPHPKQKLPKSLRDMLRRVLILAGFAGCFMALRLKLMRETPNFPVYVALCDIYIVISSKITSHSIVNLSSSLARIIKYVHLLILY